MALSIQAGAQSLVQIGIGLGDIAALVQHGRTFGNWLRAKLNDSELFETISEDYGVLLKRRGLVDATLMETRWSHQLHLVHGGHIVNVNAKSEKSNDGHLEQFSWLMVAVAAVLEVCLPSNDMRDLLIDVFVALLHRDDGQDVTESMQMQLQTNIESWKSVAKVRGMTPCLSDAIKNCRANLVGTNAIPPLTHAERQELRDFLQWLMEGKTSRFRVVSATIYSLGEALHCAGIQLELGEPEQTIEGQVAIYYAGEAGDPRDFFHIVESDLEFLSSDRKTFKVPPQRVSYLSGKPSQVIETFPRPITVKNRMAEFWTMGERAGERVKLRAVAPLRSLGIIYEVADYDECISRWDGSLLSWATEHFPVHSQSVMEALNTLMDRTPDNLHAWLINCAKVGSRVEDLAITPTEQEMDLFLCYQCLVFGYWYKLLEPWVSMDFIEHEVYLYTVWGFRDVYLLDILRRFARKLVPKTSYDESPGKVDLFRVLSVMYCGRYTYEPHKAARKLEPGYGNGLMAIVDNISVVSMSLLRPSDDPDEIIRFALVPLPIIGLLPNQNGELWAGDTAKIHFKSCHNPAQQPIRKSSMKQWSVHAKMSTSEGRLGKVVMVARCDGISVGTFNPWEAEGNVLRARANHCGNWGSRMRLSKSINERRQATPSDPAPGTPNLFFHVDEEQFQAGAIYRPYLHSQLVVVQSYGCPAMRFAAAGFYSQESHVVMTGGSLEDSVAAIKEQFTQPVSRFMSGIIID